MGSLYQRRAFLSRNVNWNGLPTRVTNLWAWGKGHGKDSWWEELMSWDLSPSWNNMLIFSVCLFFSWRILIHPCIYRETQFIFLLSQSFYLKNNEARTGKSRETECRAGVEEKRSGEWLLMGTGFLLGWWRYSEEWWWFAQHCEITKCLKYT